MLKSQFKMLGCMETRQESLLQNLQHPVIVKSRCGTSGLTCLGPVGLEQNMKFTDFIDFSEIHIFHRFFLRFINFIHFF